MTLSSTSKSAQHPDALNCYSQQKCSKFFTYCSDLAPQQLLMFKTAKELIHEWRRLLFDRLDTDYSYEEWLAQQNWFEHEDEYSLLFETIYDQPSQRRVCIEESLNDSHPSWGYVYLTNLLYKRFFDVVFTTNFDDLLNEACYLYSHELRPIVAAHDSAIQGIRVTSSRPKIIKLHGDFLYDNIKNTLAELETLEANTKKKFSQFAQEYGLVVIGYSGRDRSVMDTIELLLRDEENYKQGVYWCLIKGEKPSRRLESLLRRDRVYLVEIDGFDQFAAELHDLANVALPMPVSKPFDIARERAKLIVEIEEKLKSHPVIGSHVDEVLAELNRRSSELPLTIEASILTSTGNLNEAIPLWQRAVEEDPKNTSIALRYAEVLADAKKYDLLVAFVTEAPLNVDSKIYYLLRADENQTVIDLSTKYLTQPKVVRNGQTDAGAIARINRAIAYKRLCRSDDMMEDLDILEKTLGVADSRIKAGVAALRRDKEEMLDSIQGSFSPKELRVFPVFEDYRDDPDFIALLTLEEEDRQRKHLPE